MATGDLKADHDIDGMRLVNFNNLDAITLEGVRQWRNNESVRRWMYSNHIISPEEHTRFLDKLRNDEKNFFWLVQVNRYKVGVVGLIRCDFRNRNAYWAFYVNPELIGKGMAWLTEYAGPYLAFEFAKLRTLKLEVFSDNHSVVNLHRKAGFREEGVLRAFIEREDGLKDIIIMGMLREEWGVFKTGISEKAKKVISSLPRL